MTGSEGPSFGRSAALFDPRLTERKTVTWHAVDVNGRDLATGRTPRPPGRPSPTAALAAAPVAPWPLAVVSAGRRVGVAEALGPGGDRVEELLARLVGQPVEVDGEALVRATPAGTLDLPVVMVDLPAGVGAAARVDLEWLAEIDRRRAAGRRAVVDAGREDALEAAVHLAVLVGTERLDPADDADVDAHVASGAQLWLLAGAVVSALSCAEPDPFAAWAALVVAGWWPVGPCDGRLVVTRLH